MQAIHSLLLAAALAGLSSPLRAADAAFGEYLSGECVTCHLLSGKENGIPAIVGWPPDQFITTMKLYKTRERPNPVMQTVAGKLSDDELAALAAYFASRKLADE